MLLCWSTERLKCFLSATSYCANNYSNLHRRVCSSTFATSSINWSLCEELKHENTFTNCVITRCVMCWLSNENKGASRFQVQEHPIFPGTKIFTLWAFLCVVGAGLTSLLWNLLPTFPCVTDWQVIMPCDWLPKMTANQSQIRMGFLSSAWEKLLLGCYILIS